jgi:uncharacterized membrane protein YhaH (DUF805 family)
VKCTSCKHPLTREDKICPLCGEPNPGYVLSLSQRMVNVEDRDTRAVGKDIEYDQPQYFLFGFFQLFKPYLSLSGTMKRGQFWSIQLIIILIDLPFILYLVQTMTMWMDWGLTSTWVKFFLTTNLLWFLPLLGAEVRRLHDANLSSYWILLKLLPGPGTLLFIILLCLPSHPQTKYS